MATKLEKTLKREIEIDGQAYMVTISPEGVKLTQKGFRKGPELTWRQILASGGDDSGEGQSSGGASGGGSSSGSGWLGNAS
jgi:uncharacterized membrane protein YgcG